MPGGLLPERSADSFASWLKEHPGVEIISRDRGDEYIKGASQGRPGGSNGGSLSLAHKPTRGPDAGRGPASRPRPGSGQDGGKQSGGRAGRRDRINRRASRPRRARRLERYRRVLELHEQGISVRGIAHRLGMHRATVRHWLHAGSFPERARRHVSGRTDPFLGYLKRRWDEGCRNAAQLTREIQAMGFGGTSVMVRRRVAAWHRGQRTQGCRPPSRPSRPLGRPSSRRVSWWLLKEPVELRPEESALLRALWDRCSELKRSAELAREFAGMVPPPPG